MQRLILAALLALAVAAVTAEPAAAARDFGEFPEVPDVATGPITNFQTGPGFYLSWVKLLVGWILFLLWVRSCDWLGRDAQQLRLDYRRWSLLVYFLFAPLLLAMFVLPWFWPIYVVAWLAYLIPFIVYVRKRNSVVTIDETVFTPGHIRFWLSETLRPLGIKIEAERVKKKGPDVELVPQGSDDRTNSANLLAARQSPAFPLVLELIDDLMRRRADAVLMDYSQSGVAMKYQIDGVWHDVEPRDRETGDPILAVIKTVAALNPKERVKAQRGEFGATREKAKLAFKVASQGAKTGERVLVQLANGQVKGDRLPQLDMRDKMIEQFKQLLEQPGGLIIVSAPPASGGGLTTLLNATVGSMDRFVRGFVGVEATEKPEVDVENVPVTKYKAAAGETPMTVLPKLLREHPDVLVVADFVDADTAELLLDQAIDQHRTVVTSARAKEASEALLRMLLYKAPVAKYAEAVRAVINQRMIRKLCEKCKEAYQPPAKVLQQLGIPPGRIEALYRPPQEPEEVCAACNGVGYVGRTAMFELLVVTDEVRHTLLTAPQVAAIRQAARRGGMRTLQEEGIVLVARGVTSLPELMRVLKE